MKFRIFILCFIWIGLPVSKAQQLYFPPLNSQEWAVTSPTALGWDAAQTEAFLDFAGQYHTKALILLIDGKIVLERYYGTFTADSLWYWASAGKTLTAFMVGMAQQEAYLRLQDTTSRYLGSGWSSLPPEKEEKITIWHQLTMTSGLDDRIADPYCTDKSCLQYLDDAGTRWAYHNAPYTLLDKVMEQATGQNLNLYTHQKLKSKIGMGGAFVKMGYNNVYFSNARSMARFGLLLLNQGKWDQSPLMTDPVFFQQMVNTSQELNKAYGYLFWLNGKESFMVPSLQLTFPGPLMPNAPPGMIAALGKNGQMLNIVPQENMVLVRMGNDPESGVVPFTFNDLLWEKLNVLRLSTSNTGSANSQKQQLRAVPLAAKGHFEISWSAEYFDLEAYNLQGQKLLHQANGQNKKVLDLSAFPSGVLIIRVQATNGESAVCKVLNP